MSLTVARRRLLPIAVLAALALLLTGLPTGPLPAAAAPTDVFFSEYVEGSGNNKALEIFNGTGAAVDLAGYAVEMHFNGSATAGLTVALEGTVENGDVFVLANAGANQVILDEADQTNGSGWYNGDDAIVLRRGDQVVDSIGQVGVDPGSEWGSGSVGTHTLRRKVGIEAGDTDPTDAFDPAVEWDGFPEGTFNGLGLPGDETREVPEPEIVPIGTVQGVVTDEDDGTEHTSPLEGSDVMVQGVITQRTLARSSSGGDLNGLFVQNTAATADDDPRTSDGIFVFIGGFETLRVDGGGFYEPQVGDEVVLRGPVVEFFNLTQLSNPFVVEVVQTGLDVDEVVPADEANPPDDLQEAYRYWERREGMQVEIPAGARVLNGRNVFASTLDGEVWVVRGDHPIADRDNPYAERAFRDPHPLDNVPDELFDDGNGYRILMGSLGLKGSTQDNATLIAPARTFDTVTNTLAGGVYFSFGKYGVQVAKQPELEPGVDPSENHPPRAFARDVAYSTGVYNVENLYDFRDDPFDGCDFEGNEGCEGVSPPFDYVPPSDDAYQAQLGDLADQIATDLHGPDLLLVQEAEDQDICAVDSGELACGKTDDADGKPDTLQELALVIQREYGIAYDAAYDRDGADDRGITSAIMYRTDRVRLLPADADDPVLGSDPQVEYRSESLDYNDDVQNPKVLNAVLPDDVDRSTGTDGENVFTRAPQVGEFRIWRDGVGTSVFTDVYAVSNHFSSGPDRRVGQRREQARYNAAIVEALQEADEDVRVIVGGDFNVFPRPDDPYAPGDELYPTDQLGPLYEKGLENLYDVVLEKAPASAYSYVFEGQAQTLDSMFVTDSLYADVERANFAHINADWPAAFEGDGSRGASDHDPMVARFDLEVSFDNLRALLRDFRESGDVDRRVYRRLDRRLARAERLADRGRVHRAQVQLFVFGLEVIVSTPRHITPKAAEALLTEAARLFHSLGEDG